MMERESISAQGSVMEGEASPWLFTKVPLSKFLQ